MTPKEALEIVLSLSTWDCYNDEFHEWTEEETEAYELLKEALTELEELKRDVRRFMELYNPPQPNDEYDDLRIKLSKVGKENE